VDSPRSHIVALPCTALNGETIGLQVDWQDNNALPVAAQNAAKNPDVAIASMLARTLAWADCWGPSRWYMLGVGWGMASNADAFWTTAPWVLAMGAPGDPVSQLSRQVVWSGVGPAEVAFLSPSSTPPQGFTRTPLPRTWWLQHPLVGGAGASRLYNVFLELASLETAVGQPTRLEFPA
jgi:hypothetical protein